MPDHACHTAGYRAVDHARLHVMQQLCQRNKYATGICQPHAASGHVCARVLIHTSLTHECLVREPGSGVRAR